MGLDRPAASIDRQSSLGERLSTDFDAWLLRNMVWSFIEADDQLEYLCDGRSIVSNAVGLRKRQQGDEVAYLGALLKSLRIDRIGVRDTEGACSNFTSCLFGHSQ